MRTAVPARGRRDGRSRGRAAARFARAGRRDRFSRRCDLGRAGPSTPAGPGGPGWPRRGWCSRSSVASAFRGHGGRSIGGFGWLEPRNVSANRSATSRGLRGEGADYRTSPRPGMRRSTSSRCMHSTVRGRPSTCQRLSTMRTRDRRDVPPVTEDRTRIPAARPHPGAGFRRSGSRAPAAHAEHPPVDVAALDRTAGPRPAATATPGRRTRAGPPRHARRTCFRGQPVLARAHVDPVNPADRRPVARSTRRIRSEAAGSCGMRDSQPVKTATPPGWSTRCASTNVAAKSGGNCAASTQSTRSRMPRVSPVASQVKPSAISWSRRRAEPVGEAAAPPAAGSDGAHADVAAAQRAASGRRSRGRQARFETLAGAARVRGPGLVGPRSSNRPGDRGVRITIIGGTYRRGGGLTAAGRRPAHNGVRGGEVVG